MGEAQSGSCNDFVEDCIFCTIASNQDKNTTIIKQNDELACFRDICPAAPHHYLVIPKQHIINCRSLQSTHVGLVERMAGMGRVVLHDRGITDMSDIRLGFHRPPYTSVDHLHLHVLAPASKISHFMLHKFTPGTDRFVNEDHLRRCLLKAAPKTSIRQIQDCLLCDIASEQTDKEILLSNNELVCFHDANPGCTHHYLVVPRMHVGNCKTLQKDHIPLVEQMQEMGRSLLEKKKVSDLDDIRMGFHLPPYSSVAHLHLHVLAPASQMSSRSLTRYGPHSYWFITVDKVLHQLKIHGQVK